MPTTHDYPDIPAAPSDPLSLVKELRRRRKNISEADLDALEKAVLSAATPAAVEVRGHQLPDVAALKAACLAALEAVPIPDLFSAAGQGEVAMKKKCIEAIKGIR